MKKTITALFIGIVIIGLLGYAVVRRFVEQNQPGQDSGRMQVTASFYPLAHLAQVVGKENVEVTNLTPPGSEPHDFDPSPRDIVQLHNSKVFLYNGVGLESWASRVILELEQKGVRIVEASEGLELLGDDPHVWLDPVLMQQEVNMIASTFVVADAVHAPQYMANARAYAQELEQLDADFVQGLKTCKRKDIVTSHAAFGYLAKRYGLNMVALSGLSPDAEPAPSKLAEVSRFVRERGVTHIFFETLVSPKLAQVIAQETGAHTISFNPLEGLTSEEVVQGKTYISVQRENLQALRIALDCL